MLPPLHKLSLQPKASTGTYDPIRDFLAPWRRAHNVDPKYRQLQSFMNGQLLPEQPPPPNGAEGAHETIEYAADNALRWGAYAAEYGRPPFWGWTDPNKSYRAPSRGPGTPHGPNMHKSGMHKKSARYHLAHLEYEVTRLSNLASALDNLSAALPRLRAKMMSAFGAFKTAVEANADAWASHPGLGTALNVWDARGFGKPPSGEEIELTRAKLADLVNAVRTAARDAYEQSRSEWPSAEVAFTIAAIQRLETAGGTPDPRDEDVRSVRREMARASHYMPHNWEPPPEYEFAKRAMEDDEAALKRTMHYLLHEPAAKFGANPAELSAARATMVAAIDKFIPTVLPAAVHREDGAAKTRTLYASAAKLAVLKVAQLVGGLSAKSWAAMVKDYAGWATVKALEVAWNIGKLAAEKAIEVAKAAAQAREEAAAKANAKAEAEAEAIEKGDVAWVLANLNAVAYALLSEQQRDLEARDVDTPMTHEEKQLADANSTILDLRVMRPVHDAKRVPYENEIFLRPASKAFSNAVNVLFGDAKAHSDRCQGNVKDMTGDRLLKPVAIYEAESPHLTKIFMDSRKVAKNTKCDAREPPVPCFTDGVFDDTLGTMHGGNILESGFPLNEKILLHATNGPTVDKILQNGMNEAYSFKGMRYGPGIYMADQVCKAASYAGAPDQNSTICKILRLNPDEAKRSMYMLVFRVVLGCAARTSSNGHGAWNDNVKSEGYNKQRIYAPNSNMGDWNVPFTSLVADFPGSASYPPTVREYLMKNSERPRMLLLGVVAYEDTSITSQNAKKRVSRWW
jgi:hypothetical protein